MQAAGPSPSGTIGFATARPGVRLHDLVRQEGAPRGALFAPAGAYAAAGRYACQAGGIVGLDTRMKISARGWRGGLAGCIPD